jgi:uncharacterized membrane protein YhiD involved in acid resistance
VTFQGVVIGITSTYVIWILVDVGILIGFGKFAASILLSIVSVAVLLRVTFLEKTFIALLKGIHSKLAIPH